MAATLCITDKSRAQKSLSFDFVIVLANRSTHPNPLTLLHFDCILEVALYAQFVRHFNLCLPFNNVLFADRQGLRHLWSKRGK
jgi:hypothetical protein